MKHVLTKLLLCSTIIALIVTRLYGLNWGFPFTFHPDENNMVNAVLQLSCDIKNPLDCFNPHFYAYGQLQLYLARIISFFIPVTSNLTVTLSLRLISALASIFTGLILYKMLRKKTKSDFLLLSFLAIFTCTPGFIQQAHFGTTESLLTFFLVLGLYFEKNYALQALVVGLASATKPVGILFILFPLYTLARQRHFRQVLAVILLTFFVSIVASPHYILHFSDFMNSFISEAGVARGTIPVFYTEQFKNTIPVVFQLTKIYPYALGVPLGIIGLIGLTQSVPTLLLFLYFCALYVKWARFILPISTVMIYFGFLFLKTLPKRYLTPFILFLVLSQVIFGIYFFQLYLNEDIRVSATKWINDNLPKKSSILTEAANVYDIPLVNSKQFNVNSYFLYDLDRNKNVNRHLKSGLSTADYVIIPSRRVFKNFYGKAEYPAINAYYSTLLDPTKFNLIKTITPLPSSDEDAEETWSVFDHPTIRIFKKVASRQ